MPQIIYPGAGGGTGTFADWQPGTNYLAGDYVRVALVDATTPVAPTVFRATVDHRSGASFVADQANGFWEGLTGYVTTNPPAEAGPLTQTIRTLTRYRGPTDVPDVPPIGTPDVPITTPISGRISGVAASTQQGYGPRPTPVICTAPGRAGLGVQAAGDLGAGGWAGQGYVEGDWVQVRNLNGTQFQFQGPIYNVGRNNPNQIDFFGDEVYDAVGNQFCFNFNNVGTASLWTGTQAREQTSTVTAVDPQTDGRFLLTLSVNIDGSAPTVPQAWVVGEAIIPTFDRTGATYFVLDEVAAPNQVLLDPYQSNPVDYIPLVGTVLATSQQVAPVRAPTARIPLTDEFEVVPKWYADENGGFEGQATQNSGFDILDWGTADWIRFADLKNHATGFVMLNVRRGNSTSWNLQLGFAVRPQAAGGNSMIVWQMDMTDTTGHLAAARIVEDGGTFYLDIQPNQTSPGTNREWTMTIMGQSRALQNFEIYDAPAVAPVGGTVQSEITLDGSVNMAGNLIVRGNGDFRNDLVVTGNALNAAAKPNPSDRELIEKAYFDDNKILTGFLVSGWNGNSSQQGGDAPWSMFGATGPWMTRIDENNGLFTRLNNNQIGFNERCIVDFEVNFTGLTGSTAYPIRSLDDGVTWSRYPGNQGTLVTTSAAGNYSHRWLAIWNAGERLSLGSGAAATITNPAYRVKATRAS